jgi:hypothetical protein
MLQGVCSNVCKFCQSTLASSVFALCHLVGKSFHHKPSTDSPPRQLLEQPVQTYRTFLIIKPTRCTNFSNLFWNETLHDSDSSSVHHQEFFTVHTAMLHVIQVCRQLASRLNLLAAYCFPLQPFPAQWCNVASYFSSFLNMHVFCPLIPVVILAHCADFSTHGCIC